MKTLKLLLLFTLSLSAYAGEFTLITYNVAGLPKIVGKKNGQNGEYKHPLISPLLNDYDVVLFQEDFAYHKLLVRDILHPFFTEQKKSGFFRMGDGLNRLSQFQFNGFTRKKWSKCYGVFRRASSSDCLTPKGFSVATHELEPGIFVDIYNHHGEAGGTNGDNSSRSKNVRQLINYIKDHSTGRAVILAGDFNLHEKKPADKKHLTNILNRLDLKDTCQELECGQYHHIDRIFYRSGHGVDLSAIQWENHNEIFKDREGVRLSDHPPITVRFSWEKNNDPKRVISLSAFHSGLCLGKDSNHNAIQVDCDEKVKFEILTHRDYSISLMDIESKLCLDVERGSRRNKRDFLFSPCHFKGHQSFFLEDLSSGRLHTLEAKHSGKCLDVKGMDENEGARIIQFRCHGGENQRWQILENGLEITKI
jgi:endonuclease/exonuclease/phosphatase family metal-dependent hydrolase